MASAPADASKKILLVAGGATEEARRALSHAGYEARGAGWLDAVTSARVERPDAVVIGGELPARAAETLVAAFSSPEFRSIRVVVSPSALATLPASPVLRARVDATAEPGDRIALVSSLERALATPPEERQAAVGAAARTELGLDTWRGRVRLVFAALWVLAGTFQMTMTFIAAARKAERIAAAGRPASLAMAVGMLGFASLSLPVAKGRWKRVWYGFLVAFGAATLALAFFVPPP